MCNNGVQLAGEDTRTKRRSAARVCLSSGCTGVCHRVFGISGQEDGCHLATTSRTNTALAQITQDCSLAAVTSPVHHCGRAVSVRFTDIGEGVHAGSVAFFSIHIIPIFVREFEPNGVAERSVPAPRETLLLLVRSFETVAELRLALLAFSMTYNEQWILEGCDYRYSAQVRHHLEGHAAA